MSRAANGPTVLMLFRDRQDAGEQLATAVLHTLESSNIPWRQYSAVVYGLPRGGIIVAAPLALALKCPLDVVVAKKITQPDYPELAIGAVTAGGQIIRARQQALFNSHSSSWRQARDEALQRARKQWHQLQPETPHIAPQGRIAFIADDGIATGLTMAVAARSVWSKHPAYLFICAPVAPPAVATRLHQWCDRLVILHTPSDFNSVSRFYEAFPQVEMEEAIACLRHTQARML